MLVFFFLAAIFSGKLDFSLWTNIPKAAATRGPGQVAVRCSRSASAGIFKSLPFAIWFFLAIEEVPLAAEESMDPRTRRPRGPRSGDAHPADRRDPDPVPQHRRSPVGPPSTARPGSRSWTGSRRSSGRAGRPRYLLGLLFLIGLIASFFTIIFAYGRNTYSLSRAGYFPKLLSMTHGEAEDPARGADRRRGRRVRGRRARLRPAAEGTRRADRGGAAEHGGVRGGDLVHPADDVVRAAPEQAAEHRAAVPEPVGHPGRGDRRDPGRDLRSSRSS